jgi:hypothetical protein
MSDWFVPPVTAEQVAHVFRAYNAAFWLGHVLAYAVAAAAALCAVKPTRNSQAFVSFVLGWLWAWVGIAFFWFHGAAIHPAVRIAGLLFIVQAALFVLAGLKDWLLYGDPGGPRRTLALGLIAYAALLYPVLGLIAGYGFLALPIGAVPAAVTLFTFGVLLLTAKHVPWFMLIVPLLWAIVGGGAALLLGLPQDALLLVGGPVATGMLMKQGHARKPGQAAA